MKKLNSSHRTILMIAVVAIIAMIPFWMVVVPSWEPRADLLAESIGAVIGVSIVALIVTRDHK